MALKRIASRLLAAALVGAIIVPTVVAPAEAGPRREWRDRGGHGGGGRHGGHNRHNRPDRGGYRDRDRDNGNNVGAAIALGVIGLAAGAALAGAASAPEPIDPPYYGPNYGPADGDYYIDPAHRGTGFRKPYYPNAPRVSAGYAPEPWSREWYAYCADKFRSFEPRTGTYTTYGGEKRFCQ
ncbi:BA14K family protein [Stappia sp.]|uniref:BA14K family protein n=1 Tax=Stappia sp. TaxID=1870903 RepID=UPI003A99CF32